MTLERVEVNHRKVQKVEEVNNVQNLVDQMQEVKMVLTELLKKDSQVHKDMNRDQRLTLIMIYN
jgi:hypothetical protein